MTAAGPASRPQVLAVAPGDPLDDATWSGSSASLFGELARRELLAGTVDASLPHYLDLAARAATVHSSTTVWRERSSLGRARALTTRLIADRRGRHLDADAVVQIGSWQRPPRLAGAIRAVYLDSTFAQLLERPANEIQASSRFAKWRLRFEQAVYDDVDVVFTMSEWTRNSLLQHARLPPDKVVVAAPGPNNTSHVTASRSRQPWLAGGGPHLLFVGKKWERKGGPEVATAFEQLRRVYPGARLSIVGPTEAPVVGPGIRNWGRIDRGDVNGARLFEALFTDADLFVMPSRYEPFGIAFLEAMARGLPCVVSDRCAMPEIVGGDDSCGRIVPAQDPASLAEVLIDLAGDPEGVVAMGAVAKLRATQHFSWRRCADRIVDTINALRAT